jgi:hypothetical protein
MSLRVESGVRGETLARARGFEDGTPRSATSASSFASCMRPSSMAVVAALNASLAMADGRVS